MTIQKKIAIKHRRLYYNITLLSKLVSFIKHNNQYISETSIFPIYENSYWTMLDFNVLIDDYFQLGEDEFFTQKFDDYVELNNKLEESINLCLDLLIASTIQNINLFFTKYKRELLHTRFLDTYNVTLNKMSMYKEIEQDLNSRKKLKFFKEIGKDYNDYIDDIVILEMLKKDNIKQHRKQLYLYPLVSGIVGAMLGYFIATKTESDKFSLIKQFTQSFQHVKGIVVQQDLNDTEIKK